MLYLKNQSHRLQLKNSIKQLVSDLDNSTNDLNDHLADNAESVASYISRLNDESLNRSFLDYCSAARTFAKHRAK
ncbi:hypothetical protein [Ekhidna sp.]